jgi:hypothetical protein
VDRNGAKACAENDHFGSIFDRTQPGILEGPPNRGPVVQNGKEVQSKACAPRVPSLSMGEEYALGVHRMAVNLVVQQHLHWDNTFDSGRRLALIMHEVGMLGGPLYAISWR